MLFQANKSSKTGKNTKFCLRRPQDLGISTLELAKN